MTEDLNTLTVPALRKLAAEHNVKGRSTMAKPALIEALSALRTEVERSARIAASVPEEAVQQAARDDEAVTMTGIRNAASVVVTVAKPSTPELRATSVGNADHFKNVASYLDRMNDTIDSFQQRATDRYLKDGRKRLTARQARRVGKKVNAFMGRMGINARVA